MRILMVCLGNICRSPTAQGVLQQLVSARGLGELVIVDSCGTSNYHLGDPPDSRSIRMARTRGYDLSNQRARQIDHRDFELFDYILAMDSDNLETLRRKSPPASHGKLDLFLRYSESGLTEVPDPYYEGPEGFEKVLDLVEEAAGKLLNHIVKV
ncbi:MAG: low molecular weight protein-tyrosine-phosphatase, partial [Pseudohongiellaceae bacterium]